jgi:Ras family protein T1
VLIILISAAREDEQTTNNEIERANVIILVYVVYNLDTIKRLKSYWIPRILKINDRIPIILVGNKADSANITIEREQID